MEAVQTDAHPSGDKRFKILDTTLKRCQFQQDALIEVLHKAQELFGFLETDVLLYVARGLKLPPSRVYGVATFYHLFTLKPQGEHTCVVCMGTACFVKGADRLLAAVEAVRPRQGRRDDAGRQAVAADGPLHRRVRHRPGRGLRQDDGRTADPGGRRRPPKGVALKWTAWN